MIRFCDLVVFGGCFFLLLFTPLAFGAVHPWAYIVMESAIFVSIAAAMIKLIHLGRWHGSLSSGCSRIVIPFLLFIVLIFCQVLPIPPTLLELLSPQAYALYRITLPGWPEKPPFGDLLRVTTIKPAQAELLPTPAQARQGFNIPFDAQKARAIGPADTSVKSFISLPHSWRPLTIAPALTTHALLKLVAYGSLFFLIVLYPIGTAEPAGDARVRLRSEAAFLRSLFLVLLACGFAVALVGIVQRFAGNGKILWVFIPYDWESFSGAMRERASGPFINPDHFANYLALIFPFALAYALRPPPWFAPALGRGVRIIAGVTALVIFLAIVLSMSRFGWVALLVGAGTGLWLAPRTEISRGDGNFFQRYSAMRSRGVILVLLIAVSIWLIGPQARQSLDLRLAETVSEDGSLRSRFALWRDSLEMIRDFPLLGVGLGAWGDLFPHYRRASASETSYREAHNDYVQLFAETGLIGFTLLGLVFFQVGRIILGALARMPAQLRSFYVPCVGALAIMSLHELVDFSLQIPANAVLFIILLAVTVRLAVMMISQQQTVKWEVKPWLPASALAFAAGLIAAVFTQDLVPFPYNLAVPTSVAEAADRIAAHPAQAIGHVMLARLIAGQVEPVRQVHAYATAAWLHPSDANLKDLHASALLRNGQLEQGLKEISESVSMVPSMARHFYLHERILPWLAADEKHAIEAGFQQAFAGGDRLAAENLAVFYERTGQPLARAKHLAVVATQSTGQRMKVDLMLKAAESYIAAKQTAQAAEFLRQAMSLQPDDPRPYRALALSVYAGQREQIAAVIAEGIKNKAEPFPLYLSLAQAMQQAGASEEVKSALRHAGAQIATAAARGQDPLPLLLALAETANKVGALDDERSALEKAAEHQPASTETLNRLGNLYLRLKQPDRAAQILTRLVELRPESAEAFFQLAQAEEARYSYGAADAAFKRAIELEPDNRGFQGRRDEFKQRLAAALSSEAKK